MNLAKHKRWRAHKVLQNNKKREQTRPVCLQAPEKYEKVESVNSQNNHEKASKK